MIKPYFLVLAAVCSPLLYGANDLEKKAKQLFEAGDYGGQFTAMKIL